MPSRQLIIRLESGQSSPRALMLVVVQFSIVDALGKLYLSLQGYIPGLHLTLCCLVFIAQHAIVVS